MVKHSVYLSGNRKWNHGDLILKRLVSLNKITWDYLANYLAKKSLKNSRNL